jgi:hypothetical protein
MLTELAHLLKIIEKQLDWGDASGWQSRDFENLNQLIFEKIKVSLSASTLRRIWGRVEYKHLPSTTTLDTLARFANYENWRAFVKQQIQPDKKSQNEISLVIPAPVHTKRYTIITCFIIVIAIICLGSFFIFRKTSDRINPNNYSFSSERLAKGIPNSVIFNYDATASPTDSVYIQQSWDPHTKTLVRKSLHQHTSVYYEPGFYQAELVIGHQIVKQHKLMIPTTGWLGLIENRPVPVYLNNNDFVFKDVMRLPATTIKQKNISMELQPTLVKYYNVGNFEPVDLKNFSFSVAVKNEYWQGAAACQFTSLSLITNGGPIIIQLSAKGCVSEISLLDVEWIISGKTANLSGFGVDFTNWVQVSCKSAGNEIQYFVNQKLVYEAPMPTDKIKIVGMGYSFQGTGAVKNIDLRSGDKEVFKAF